MRAHALLPTAPTGWRWAVLGGLLGLIVAVALFAPARWLASAVSGWSEGRVLLVNPRGTVWSGQAAVVFASGAGGGESVSLPGALQWRLRPGWGAVNAALEMPCCAVSPLHFRAHRRDGAVQLDWQDARSRWPAAMLGGFGAPWNTLKLEGALELSTRALSVQFFKGQLQMAGQATLDATDMSSSLSTLRPMGSYRLRLDGGPTPSLLLSTREGSLELNGSGVWSGTAFRFNGEATAAPGRESALSNLLNIIGRRDNARSIITLG